VVTVTKMNYKADNAFV